VSAVNAAACRLANLHKENPRDPAAITAARHDLTQVRLERAILEALAVKPVLPAARRLRLAQILIDGGIR
jgi:hypothetical protein